MISYLLLLIPQLRFVARVMLGVNFYVLTPCMHVRMGDVGIVAGVAHQSSSSLWLCPLRSFVKVNCDNSFDGRIGRSSGGFLFRDCQVEFLLGRLLVFL